MTTPDDTDRAPNFAALGLTEPLVGVLADLGYEEPTPIQASAIPIAMGGRDVLGQAATGTGKTAAFALPIVQRLIAEPNDGTRPVALVLVPTRELAMQVSEAIHTYGRKAGVRVIPVYGGQHITRQLKALDRGVDVVVATPGRALDHLGRGSLNLADVRTVVLDEADEMLDMGFVEDIDALLEAAPSERQTLLFSATLPKRITALAAQHLTDPERIRIEAPRHVEGEAPLVRQVAYVVSRAHKAAALGRILDLESPEAAIVFCRTRRDVDALTETLNGRGYRAEALHGGMDQGQRDRVMGRLRTKTAELLVATDVAARGLDIDHLTHVINHEVPSATETYVHRIGRVGRAGREGVAITLAEPREHRQLRAIAKSTGRPISIERLPTVADLRSRRLEMTRAAVREAIVGEEELDRYRSVIDALADEFDIVEIALAAVRVAHEATVGEDDAEEIPEPPTRDHSDRPPSKGSGAKHRGGGGGGTSPGMARLFIGAGRASKVRPQDLVGAIAGETSLTGRQVGAISIAQRFSLVEVPEDAADEVIAALRTTTLRGRRPTVRRDRAAG